MICDINVADVSNCVHSSFYSARAEQAVNSYKWQCVSRSNLLSWASHGSDYAYKRRHADVMRMEENGIKLHSNSIDRAVVRRYMFTLFNYLSVCVIAAFIFLRVCVSKLIKSLHSDGTSHFSLCFEVLLFTVAPLTTNDERLTVICLHSTNIYCIHCLPICEFRTQRWIHSD